MAKVKIQGHASGTGVLTVTAPNTSTDRTITLPDGTGSLIADDGSGNVGIGTASPSWKLSVLGGRSIFTDTTQYAIGVRKNSTESGNYNFWIGASATNDTSVPNLVFSNNDGDEKLRIQSGGGISFNGDTAAANALDDYEEGTWTPTLNGTTGGGSGINFSYRLGWYTKVGRLVIANCRLAMSSWSSGASGSAQISGLPFSPPASSNYFSAPSIGYTHNFDSDNAPKGGFVEEGSSVIRLIKANDSDARQNFSQNVSASALNGNETIFVSVAYIVSA